MSVPLLGVSALSGAVGAAGPVLATPTAGLLGAGGSFSALAGANLAGGVLQGLQSFTQGQAQATQATIAGEVARGEFAVGEAQRLAQARRDAARGRARAGAAGQAFRGTPERLEADIFGQAARARAFGQTSLDLNLALSGLNAQGARRDAGFGLGLGLAGGVLGARRRSEEELRFGV